MQLEPERLVKILEVLRELPVPNYRCAPCSKSQPPTHSPGALTGPFQLPDLNPTSAWVLHV